MKLDELLAPTYANLLTAMSAWLDKAERQLGDERAAQLLSARLAPDMFPLSTQVRFSCVQAMEGICRLTGEALPDSVAIMLEEGRAAEETPGTIADAKARLAETLAWVDTASKAIEEPEGDSDLAHELPNGMVFDFTADEYARDWAMPQFLFHVVTAYAIMRAQGVELGKLDYVKHLLGKVRPGTVPQPQGN